MLAAFIGSTIVLLRLYAFCFYDDTSNYETIVLFLIVYTLWFSTFRYYLENLLTFYFVTFMVGGGLIGTHYFIANRYDHSQMDCYKSKSVFGDPISWIFVIIGFPLFIIFLKSV